MKRLFVGPWVGEFGIELLRWHGYARTVAKRERWDEVIVAAQPDRFFLYEDFATRFVPYPLPSIHTEANRCRDHVYNDLHKNYIDETNGDLWLSPLLEKPVWDVRKHEMKKETTYLNFADRGSIVPGAFDILIHARSSPKHSEHDKNWPLEYWHALLEKLRGRFSIASIGAKDGAHHVAGTSDLREIPLHDLAGYCRKARFVLGPSSGPMHFAVFSGAPAVTWVHIIEPYTRKWNPFDVPLCCLPTWRPSPDAVLSKIRHLLAFLDKPAPRYFVFGTKRSGHHAVIDWIANLDSDTEITHLNDCAFQHVRSTPSEPFCIESPFSFPKLMNEPRANDATRLYNPDRLRRASLFSFEEIPIHRIPDIPEIAHAEILVFVLRDSANFLSSLARGLPYYGEKPFTHPAYREMLKTYRDYLAEALGRTGVLRRLTAKIVFVSFNRWHVDENYRRSIASALDLGHRDADRSRIAQYGPGSSFDKDRNADASRMDVLNRWTHDAGREDFLSLLDDPVLAEMEQAFHGEACPPILRRFQPTRETGPRA